MSIIPLSELSVGEKAMVEDIKNSGSIKRRLHDLGFVKGESIEKVMTTPFGDPCVYSICGSVIALRNSDAKKIAVQK